MDHPPKFSDVGAPSCTRRHVPADEAKAVADAYLSGNWTPVHEAMGTEPIPLAEQAPMLPIMRRIAYGRPVRKRRCDARTRVASRDRVRPSARRRRESHRRSPSPTRGSPDDSEGEPSPSAIDAPAGPVGLASPLRGLHAKMIARSALVDGSTVAEYVAGVLPYLPADEPALLRDFLDAAALAGELVVV